MQAQSPIEAQGQRGLKKYKPWAYNRENTVYYTVALIYMLGSCTINPLSEVAEDRMPLVKTVHLSTKLSTSSFSMILQYAPYYAPYYAPGVYFMC